MMYMNMHYSHMTRTVVIETMTGIPFVLIIIEKTMKEHGKRVKNAKMNIQ